MMSLYAVILCGGRGERFWPKSRRTLPKQFIALFGRNSLTQETSARIRPLCPPERQLFVAPAEFEVVLRRQLGPRACLAFEPVGRNTAPAIGLAAVYLQRQDPDSTMVVLPADHLIEDRPGFLKAVRMGAQLAQQGLLVTFGIRPDRPDTGYGYIQLGRKTAGKARLTAHRVQAFKEKPSPARARAYLAAGNYVWNSGMFIWRVDAILAAFREFMPEFHAKLEEFATAIGTRREKQALAHLYRGAPSISIDYAVMEKADNVACVRGAFDWDDVGSWLALVRHIKPDSAGNVASGLFVSKDSTNCVADSDSGIVAALGVKNLVIVRAGDAVLVADRKRLGQMKQLLAEIAGHAVGGRHL
ncbi:MAG: mannose-1-phosphate guanylyltransferase [candidate division WOR-3 bacterium]|nr:mannose-1-phosphate guanylyltransferase [candidate division WOR-3 bacterium]